MINKEPDDRQKPLLITKTIFKKLGIFSPPLPRQFPQLRAPALPSSRLFIPCCSWVQARQATHGDHPPLLQLLEMWVVILFPPWILTRVKKLDL